MEYRKLGNTDIDVSVICLGTMTWGEQNSFDEGYEQMDYAVDNGVNFFDTAELYPIPPKAETQGRTEECIGNWFKKSGKRDEIILASKVAGRAPMNWFRGEWTLLDRENIETAIDASLERLQTDYIDLYQLHWPDRRMSMFGSDGIGYKHYEAKTVPILETLRVLSDLVTAGKIRYVGLSNETPWGASKFLQISKEKKLPRMMSVQNPYNLLNRTYEIGLAEISVREQMGLLAYSPLAIGFLTGKYRNQERPEKSRLAVDGDFWTRYNKPNTEKAVDAYYEIAKKFDLDMAQMSLKFCEIQPFVTSVIIGATRMDQLKTDIESVNVNLTKEILKEINEVQSIYPNPCP